MTQEIKPGFDLPDPQKSDHIKSDVSPNLFREDSDRRLVAAIRRGSKEDKLAAVEVIYNRHCHFIYSYTLSKVNWNREVAQEILSEVFLTVLEDGFENVVFGEENSSSRVLAWLCVCARNRCQEKYRERDKFTSIGDDEYLYFMPSISIEDEKGVVVCNLRGIPITIGFIQEVLGQLSEKERDGIGLKYFAQLPDKEIAEILELTNTATRAFLYRTRRKLRKLVEKYNENDV